jgi:glyoxylase-like metal-dependent hydrolase (beta-lactamase superfamily II)/predicted ester cyclase
MAAPTTSETTAVARRYFDAVTARDPDAMADRWAPGAVDTLVGDQELVAPEGVRSYFSELFGAFPDFTFVVRSMITEGDRCAVLWRATGTFAGPGSFQGVEPTGARIEMEGCDVVEVRDGRLHGNLAHINQLALARQIGLLPPARSAGERRLYAAFNQRTRAVRALAGRDEEWVADGVWVIRGGMPGRWVNAFLIEEEGGVVAFDAGVRSMASAIAAAAARHGGLRRVVLGSAHPDHRGGAPALRVPVVCHADERPDAEGDGGVHYFDYGRLPFPASRLTPTFMRSFDGGPVEIADTLAEGDEVTGFRVVHLPGHAPGLIGLWRESDGLALTNDCFAMFDAITLAPRPAAAPHPAFNWDTEAARASMRKLATLEPAAAWPGHRGPLTADVRAVLEEAAGR